MTHAVPSGVHKGNISCTTVTTTQTFITSLRLSAVYSLPVQLAAYAIDRHTSAQKRAGGKYRRAPKVFDSSAC